jgi:hypothetical protein
MACIDLLLREAGLLLMDGVLSADEGLLDHVRKKVRKQDKVLLIFSSYLLLLLL